MAARRELLHVGRIATVGVRAKYHRRAGGDGVAIRGRTRATGQGALRPRIRYRPKYCVRSVKLGADRLIVPFTKEKPEWQGVHEDH